MDAFAQYLAQRWGLAQVAAEQSARIILSKRPWRIDANAPRIVGLAAYVAFDAEYVRFDPSQPRDEGGKWTSGGGNGGGPTAFVSPSVSSQTFEQAVASLSGKEQANLKAASSFIDNKLGISSQNYPAIGAWADGAENSMMVVAPGASAAEMRAACAMKGYLADQKSVLMFEPKDGGDAYMASFDVTGSPVELHDKLLKDGLAFHTLQPLGENKIRVHVYGSDTETIDAVTKSAKDSNAQVRFIQGAGEFLGTTKDAGTDREQRDDARRVYEEAIREISDTGGLGGRDVGAIWNEARDYWTSLSAKALRGLTTKISDAELYARFRATGEDAREWPGLKSEYDAESGRAERFGAQIKWQVQEEKTPAARGQTTTVSNPVRSYATQYWLDPIDNGGGPEGDMLPGFYDEHGKHPIYAETLDGRLHIMDGHHTLFHHLRNGGGALQAFVFEVPTAIFEDGKRFDPNQPRDETGKWTDGGGDTAAGEKPSVGERPRLEGRLRGSNPSVERVNAWSDQVMIRQEQLAKEGLAGGKEDNNLQYMSGAIGAYLRVKSGLIPSEGRGFNFIYAMPQGLDTEEDDIKLEAAIVTSYDAETKVAKIDYNGGGGVTPEAHMAVAQDAVIRCEGEGAKRVEANIWSDDEDVIKMYEEIGFDRGAETAGIVTMFRGEARTPEETEVYERREAERKMRRDADITNTARDVAKDMDFDASRISLGTNQDPHVDFVLNGREFKAAGLAYNSGPEKGTIKLFPDQLSTWGDAVERVTAHEIKHVKWQNALDRWKAEEKTMMQNPAYGSTTMRDAVTGELKPEYAAKFPIYALMEQTFGRHGPGAFHGTDGVSDYSKEYWKQYEEKGPLYYPLAVNETLAEMAAIKYTKGTFPGHMAEEFLSAAEKREGITRWRDLYRAVEKIHQMSPA